MQRGHLNFLAVFSWAFFLLAADARADRLAVLAMPSQQGDAPIAQADRLTSHLLAKHHRTIASPDAAGRLLRGNEGAGSDWAAALTGVIQRGRAALTRLDRHGADQAKKEVRKAIERMGGGAGGRDVLVEWALLEAALASASASASASTSASASGPASGHRSLATTWMDKAAAFGPDIALDPLVHPETERNAFETAVGRLPERGSGSLAVVTIPPAAQLWVDGSQRCRTPCTVKLAVGQHFARITSPAHTPAVLSVKIVRGKTLSRRIGLTSAYTGASLDAVRAMLDNPSRTSEAQSSLRAIAEFLDVDHVLVLRRGPRQSFALRVAPAVEGNDAFRGGLSASALPGAADGMLRSSRTTGNAPGDDAWYENTTLWVGVAVVTAAAVGGGFYLFGREQQQAPSQGTLVIGGR